MEVRFGQGLSAVQEDVDPLQDSRTVSRPCQSRESEIGISSDCIQFIA